jgi:hypothetical protein
MGTLNTAFRNALAQVPSDLLDTGTGVLEIGTSGMAATLVTFDINATQSTGVTTGVWTVDFDNATVAAGDTGTMAEARLRESGTPTYELTGLTVSTSGADINFDNTSVTNGQNVTLNPFTITVPATTT